MVDLNADVDGMDIDELLEYQQAATRLRLEASAAGRRAQTEIDRRAAERAERRRLEDEQFGASTKPPAQQVFGSSEEVVDRG